MEINIENISLEDNHFYYTKKIKHPYIYPDGCIDVDPIARENKNLTLKEVFEYLQTPQKYFNNTIPVYLQ